MTAFPQLRTKFIKLFSALLLLLLIGTGLAPEASAILYGSDASDLNGQVQVWFNNRTRFCTGILISPTWVLTSRHCVTDAAAGPGDVEVFVGNLGRELGDLKLVNRIINHPTSDAALLQLTTRVTNGDLVVPYGVNDPLAGSLVTVSGWGATQANPNRPAATLQFSSQTVAQVPGTSDQMTLSSTDGSRIQDGDSGAGVDLLGVICGVVSSSNPLTAQAVKTSAISGWITTTTGIPPGGVCLLDQTKKKKTGRLKVMTLGGVLTRGGPNDNDGAFRKILKTSLDKFTLSMDFVGSRKNGVAPYDYWEGRNFDLNPSQLGTIHDTEEQVKCSIPALPNAPDIITVELGEEDIQEFHSAGAAGRIDSLLTTIQKMSLGTTLLVTAHPPPPRQTPAEIPYVDDLNTAVKLIVLGRKSAGQHVDWVDESSMTADDEYVFPSYTSPHLLAGDGAEKMANNFAVAVENALNAGWIYPYPRTFDGSLCPGGIVKRGLPDLRLMPMGDSITHGYHSSSDDGYRKYLRADLVNDGFKTDFVGGRQYGSMYDNYNEGYSGYRIDALDLFEGNQVSKYRPNIITLMIGTNDMVQNTDLPNAPARLTKLLDDIYSNDPGVTVLLATIIPSTDPAVEARIPAYNQALPGVVQGQVNQGRNVVLVDMSSFTTADLAAGDQLHPGDSGYEKIANLWHSAIQQEASTLNAPVDCSMIPVGCSDPAITAGSEQAGRDPNPPLSPDSPALDGNGNVAGGAGGSSTGGRTNQKLRMADFDGDGKADYIGVSDAGGLTVWYNHGGDSGGGWSPAAERALGTAPGYQVQLADFDGDGKADYISVLDNGNVKVWLNRGGDNNGGWDELGVVALGEGPANQVRFADMDGDGKADYLIVGPGGSIDYWQNRGGDNRGGWGPDLHIAYGVAPSNEIQLQDFDGDGKADYIVVAANGSEQVWLNKTGEGLPGGDWKQISVAAGVGFSGDKVIMADVDGDGRADYLGVGPGGSLTAWLNNGGDGQAIRGWSDQGMIALGVGAPVSQIQFADMADTHKDDYLVVNPNTGAVDIYVSHGPQPKGTPWTWDKYGGAALGVPEYRPGATLTFGTVSSTTGKSNYIVLSATSAGHETAYFYLNQGPGNSLGSWSSWIDSKQHANLLAPLESLTGDNPRPIFTDMTGDGMADLVWLHSSGALDGFINADDFSKAPPSDGSDQTAKWLWQGQMATGVGPDANHAFLGDLDGDRKADYLTLSSDGRTLTGYQNLSGGGKWTWGSPYKIPGKVSCKVPSVASSSGSGSDNSNPRAVLADVTGGVSLTNAPKVDFLCVHPDGSVQAWKYLDGTEPAPANGWNYTGAFAAGYVISGLQ